MLLATRLLLLCTMGNGEETATVIAAWSDSTIRADHLVLIYNHLSGKLFLVWEPESLIGPMQATYPGIA